ncbi:MAG: hypothetical protein ABI947_09840 [Chloroflexota bacterium]
MKRWLPILLMVSSLATLALACNLGSSAPTGSESASASATTGVGTIVAATSSIPTSTPNTTTGSALPAGTLILSQAGNPLAQVPNATGQTISLTAEHFGNQASPDGRYGVRVVPNNKLFDLLLVDFSTSTADPGKAIPQGTGLSGPEITWKDDTSGFAFFDIPADASTNKGILYYDLASGQTKQIVPAPTEPATVASSIAFSPDGKYFVYALGKTEGNVSGQGANGPLNKTFLLDSTTNQGTALPDGSGDFTQWMKDSKRFVTQRFNNDGTSQIVVYSMGDLNNPKVITPAKTSDFLVDGSPDSKYLVVTSLPSGQAAQQPAQIYISNLDGSNRKALTKFTNTDQSITGLVWGNSGIYYSVTGADNQETTWRMDLDGTNAAQVAQGTLNGIVGER